MPGIAPKGLEFDQERFVPFFYSQVTDRLSVAARSRN